MNIPQDPEGAPESKKLAADDKSLSTGEDVVAKPGLTREDSIAETLTCQICQVQEFVGILINVY